jgi:hypothetical protein
MRARLAWPRLFADTSPGGGSRLRGFSAPLKDPMVTTARSPALLVGFPLVVGALSVDF